MIDANHFLLALVALIFFGQILAFIITSKKFWIATDYLWYALAALSVGLFVSDLNDRLKHEEISIQLSEVERQSTGVINYFEDIKARTVCLLPDASCTQISNVLENLTNFQATVNWPLGDFEDNLEENFSSLPAYLNKVSSEFNAVSQNSLKDLPKISENLTTAIAELEAMQEWKTWKVSVAIMRLAVYLFAVGIALKIGKVTSALRQEV